MRPVRLINPWAAGGPADFVGRLYAKELSDMWGKQVITDNRPGASGIIGTEIVTRAVPDGYTLLFSTISTFAINGILIKKIPYNVDRDLALVGITAVAPYILAVRARCAGAKCIRADCAREETARQAQFASAGPGTIVHMAGEQFKHEAGIDIVHIP